MNVVIVSGAGGLLGRSVVRRLREENYEVLGIGSNRKKPVSRSAEDGAALFNLNLLSNDAAEKLLQRCQEFDNGIYGFVHLARSKENLKGPDSDRQNWLAEFELAVFVPYTIGRLLAMNFGLQRLVVGSSIYGLRAQKPDLYEEVSGLNPHYGASRAASIQMVRDLAVQLAPQCLVNSVSWGGINDLVGGRQFAKTYSEKNPSSRMLFPEEAAEAIVFALSSRNSGMTGHNLVVDGGWTAW